MGIVVVCICFFVIYNYFNDKKPKKLFNPFDQSFNIYIISIGIISFFSYPLRIPEVANTIFILFVLYQILGNNYSKTIFSLNISKYFALVRVFAVICILYFGTYCVVLFKILNRNIKLRTQTSTTSSMVDGIAEYMLKNDYSYLQSKRTYYFNDANFEWAEFYIEKANQLSVTYRGLMNQGDINSRLKRTSKAIKLYETAVYMIPIKFESKQRLMEEYWLKKDTLNTEKWAQIIINQKPKVESDEVTQIKERAREVIKLIGNSTKR